MVLLLFAFLSGLVTILAPCIWPLLPIVLAASTAKGTHRPLGVAIGIMISFAFFTLAISTLVKLFGFDPNSLRVLAVIVIGLLGLSMLFSRVSVFLEGLVSKVVGVFGECTKTGNGLVGGFLTGLVLGIIWTPCAGPILAAVAALAATGKVTGTVILITLFYVVGVGIPLFIFAYGGQKIFSHTRFISSRTGAIQKIFGLIMLFTAFAIYTNYDIYLQSQILNALPQLNATFNQFESNPEVTKQLNILRKITITTNSTSNLFNDNTPAPDFAGISKWLNLPAGRQMLHMSDLRGKVVLVDFWTYTCINCIRTLPHITNWYEKYKDNGFVVIGVHTPEFAFEHDTSNVENAIKMFGIHYPVAQDNNYATWNNYSNQYWPAEYLIDAKGNIRRTEFGEGNYDQMELAIRELLKEAGRKVNVGVTNMTDTTPAGQLSPETYIGSNRMQYYYPSGSLYNGLQTLSITDNPPLNSFSLGGIWDIESENSATSNSSSLVYHFYASNVYLVLRPGKTKNPKVKVFLDGNLIDSGSSGSDVKNVEVTIDSDRLYNLVNLHGNAGDHILKLEFEDSGIEVFAFTFG